jgi:type II secretory pathway component GspD/PulD (secretin)
MRIFLEQSTFKGIKMNKNNLLASAFIIAAASGALIDQPVHSQILTKGVQISRTEDFVTKIVSLKNRTADDVYKLVQNLKKRIDIDYDSSTNSIVLMGDRKLVDQAEILCKNLDSMPVDEHSNNKTKLIKDKGFVTKTYGLELNDYDDLEKELEAIIDRKGNDSDMSEANSKDNLNKEYFLINKEKKVVIVHTKPEKFAVIDEYFKEINKPSPQVLIEASIVAVDDGLEKQLGIKWNGFEGTSGYFGPQEKEEEETNPLAALMGGGGNEEDDDGHNGKGWTSKSLRDYIKYGGTWNFSSVQALLRAVEQDGKSQVLSKPRLMTIAGETSSIHVGDEIPYTSGKTVTDGGNVTSSIEFKKVGIKLDVTPSVNKNDDKTVNMKVAPEVSQYIRDVVMGDNKVPQVSTRRAESTIKVKDGETVVIGGLIETKLLRRIYKLPILGSLPVIGKAFRSKTNSNEKTNLMILLTVHILDENSKQNTVSKNALKEINNIENIKDSVALKELSMPVIEKPGIYGKDIKSEDDLQNENTSIDINENINYENTEEVLNHLNKRLEKMKKNHK